VKVLALAIGFVRLWHVPNEAGQVEAQSSQKCEGSAVLLFNLYPVLIFSKPKLSGSCSLVQVGKRNLK
jgi:hypothetical protein